ncbi:MAG: hypothetical protein WEB60_03825 [Terrimicrobiaceae bacterium]
MLQSLTVWPDRLRTTRWRRRVRVEKLSTLLAMQAEGIPMILATLHTHGLSLLRHSLRSHGLPAATLVLDGSGHGDKTGARDALLDQRMGLVGSPNLFDTREIRAAVQFLKKGGCLIIACDTRPPQSLTVRTPQGGFTMALGPLRMARLTGATVFPAVVCEERPWRVVIHIGNPINIPGEASTGENRGFESACASFAHAVLPIVAKYPEQMDPTHVHCWSS